jgi:hypothetical protein
MKKLIISLLCLISLNSFGKTNNEFAKDVLEIARQTISNEGYAYLIPGKISVDEKTGNIVQQVFYDPAYSRSWIVKLEWKDKQIRNIYYGSSKFAVKWENGIISYINCTYYVGREYNVLYDQATGKISKMFIESKNKKGLFFGKDYVYDGDRVSKITKYQQKGKNKTIKEELDFTYSENGIAIKVSYPVQEKSKKTKDETIKSSLFEYSSIGDSICIQKLDGKLRYQVEYNNMFEAFKWMSIDGTKVTYNGDKYIKGKHFSTSREERKDGNFVSKEINILYSLEVQDEKIPAYERTKGTYRFDETGDLIYESNGVKFRTKMNGYWSDWNYHTY